MKIIFLTLTIFITSCSSTPQIPSSVTPEFKTRITNTGLKHFQYKLLPKEEDIKEIPLRRTRNKQQPPPSADKLARKNESMLVAHAEIEINTRGFCREGFWLIDKNLYGNAPYIRGECNELATEADRQDFPDSLFRW